MQLSYNRLKNLPVYTRSHDYLGKIEDIEINSQTHAVSCYIVSRPRLIQRLSVKKLMIAPAQVLQVDNEKMEVEDGLIKELKESLVKDPLRA